MKVDESECVQERCNRIPTKSGRTAGTEMAGVQLHQNGNLGFCVGSKFPFFFFCFDTDIEVLAPSKTCPMAVTKRTLYPKPLYDEEALLSAFEEAGINQKHARKIWRLFVQQRITSYQAVPELPKAALELLERDFAIMTSRVVSRTDAVDGSTTKLLVELQDGQRIESVIMRYGDVVLESFPEQENKKRTDIEGKVAFKSNKRATLCVSSQVGCAMACTFCGKDANNVSQKLY